MSEIEIGDLVEDRITGFQGAIIAKHTSPFNEDNFCVKPMELKDDQPIKAVWIDGSGLKVIEKQKLDQVIPCPEPKFIVGQKVKDITTPFEGIIVGISYYVNGCIRYGVQPSTLHEGKPLDALNYPENQLKLKRARQQQFEESAVAETENSEPHRTGGPLRMPKDRNGY